MNLDQIEAQANLRNATTPAEVLMLVDLVRKQETQLSADAQALADSNLALIEQTEIAQAANRQAEEWTTAWHDMRSDVLSGIDGFDNDQVNTVLGMLDNYEPSSNKSTPDYDTEYAKVVSDANLYGMGFMIGGRHVHTETVRVVMHAAPQQHAQAETREQIEQRQRAAVAEKFANRSPTPANADFDLPAENDSIEHAQAALSGDQLDVHINAILRPTGTKVSSWRMQGDRDDMRAAMRAILATRQTAPVASSPAVAVQVDAKPAITHLVYQTIQKADGSWTRDPVNQTPQESLCEDCGGTGRQHVGYSGQESDGNAPLDEPCGSCGYAASVAAAVQGEELQSLLTVFDMGLGFALCHRDFGDTRNAIKKLQKDFTAIRVAVGQRAASQPDSYLIGRKVSLDVSTGDDDADHRIFGTVYAVQDGDLLANEDSRNWTEPYNVSTTVANQAINDALRVGIQDSERAAALLDVLVKIKREADTGRVAYGVVALNEIIRIVDAAMAAQQGKNP